MFQEFSGKSYLKIDIASNFGLEKSTWQERISWFDKHETKLLEMLPHAEEPALFYAGVRAWEAAKAGIPSGYMISLDATSSGLQLLAVLTGDKSAAELCNVVDTGKRRNAYTGIYERMLHVAGQEAKIDPDMVKQAIMTSLYGSTAMPKKVFGEGKLLDVFYHTMSTAAPAAWELNQALVAIWDDTALSNDWVLPDNFHVHIKVMNQVKDTVNFLNKPFDVFYKVNEPTSEGRSLPANSTHSVDGMVVREMTRRCDYDPIKVNALYDALDQEELGIRNETQDDKMVTTLWKHYIDSGYLSARIIDHLCLENFGLVDEAVILDLLNSLPDRPFKVVSIHDCFRCLPNYGNDLRKQYNLQLALISQSKLLGFILSQLVKRPINIGKLHPNLHKQIVHTNYALS